jgi:ankyrin repeat protein
LETVKTLVELGADVNKPGNNGFTPLMWAARRNHTSCVAFLLEKGASIYEADNTGQTALDHAIKSGSYPPATLLYFKGLRPKSPEYYSDSAEDFVGKRMDLEKFINGLVTSTVPEEVGPLFYDKPSSIHQNNGKLNSWLFAF